MVDIANILMMQNRRVLLVAGLNKKTIIQPAFINTRNL